MSYEYLNHTADVGIRVSADTLEAVFIDAATALFNLMYDPHKINLAQSFPVVSRAPSDDVLVIEYLNELLSLMDINNTFFSKVTDITFARSNDTVEVRCTVWGESQSMHQGEGKIEVKAATYSGLQLTRQSGKIIFQCLFDI